MKTVKLRVGLSLGVLGLAVSLLWGCPATVEDESYMMVTASPKTLYPDGTQTDITVSAAEADGTSGRGMVTLSVRAGSLGEEGVTETTAELSNGRASLKYWCNAANESACAGSSQRITVTWKDIIATVTIKMTSAPGEDAGMPGLDAEAPPPDADMPPDAEAPGPDAGPVNVKLSASKANLYFGVGESATITAQLLRGDAGVSGEPVTLETDLGGFFLAQDGISTATSTISLTTGDDGAAKAEFTGDFGDVVKSGSAQITATHSPSSQSAAVKVDVIGVSGVTYKGLTCSTTGANCTMLGLKGSGWNEYADAAFLVTDNAGKPVADMLVDFSFNNQDFPDDTTLTQTARTDSTGTAKARVTAGNIIGVVTVKATVVPTNPKEALSAAIGVRAAKPSNRNFTFSCATKNIPALIAVTPPASLTVNCKVNLYDRFNNPIGTGATVYFRTEAGSIDSSVVTKAWSPTGSNADEGSGSVTFHTTGTFPPTSVDPLPADPAQLPFPRAQEPSVNAGSLVYNPRDMLVTIVAYADGEEFWDDKNLNGQWDPGETFIDQGAPFVDVNDNNIFDSADTSITTGDTTPNGVHDSAAKIWAEARILYTGQPASAALLPNPFPNVGKSPASQRLDFFFPDQYLNRLTSQGTAFTSSHVANKGSVALANAVLLDGYGFGYERRSVNVADGTDCMLGTHSICQWKVFFTDWTAGYAGYATVTGAIPTDTTPAASDIVTVKAALQGVTTQAQASGVIE